AIEGPQEIIIEGLNDIIEANTSPQTYDFDYSWLPAGTATLDVDVRIQIDGHTWLPDLNIEVIAPSGAVQSVFQLTGCFGAEFPINCWFDDEGTGNLMQCVDLDGGANADNYRIQPVQLPGVSAQVLNNLDGEDASGVWQVRISDAFAGDDGIIRVAGR